MPDDRRVVAAEFLETRTLLTAPTGISLDDNHIPEHAGINAVVGTLSAIDPTSAGPYTFILVPGSESPSDNGLFNIDPLSQTLRANSSFNFSSEDPPYIVALKVTNRFSESSGVVTFTVIVTNVDEAPPTFTSGATASINENVAANTVVYTAVATDTDFNAPATANSITYAFGGGADDNDFNINSSTGAVTIKASPDRETKGIYNFTVKATDAANNFSTRAVSLTINNLDEVAPTITSGAVATAISENSGAGQVIYTITSTDSTDYVAGSTTYSLMPLTGDVAAFTINTTTGAVTLTENPNFEVKSSYSFTVVATDVAGNSSTLPVTLAINDVNEATFESNNFYNTDANAERNTSTGLAGTGQRSMIRNVQVVFNGDVTIPTGTVANSSFVITKLGTTPTNIGLTVVSSSVASGKTAVVLGFTSGTLPSGSLADGNYRLVIDYGVLGIDGDGNGTIGGTRTVNFHRLFGDSDGDRDVDASDYKNYVAGVRGTTKWISIFDADNDGSLKTGSLQDEDDKIAFFANYGRSI